MEVFLIDGFLPDVLEVGLRSKFNDADFLDGELVVGNGCIEDIFHHDFDGVSDDSMEPLGGGGDELIIDGGDDGGRDGGYRFLIPLNRESVHFFFLGLLVFLHFILIVFEDLAHAIPITAFVVDQDEPFPAWSADVAEHILHAPVDVDVALAFEQMIVR